MKYFYQLNLFTALLLLTAFWNSIAVAQIGNLEIKVDINVSEYDVVFLTEFFDVRSQKLASSAPGFSVELKLSSTDGSTVPNRLPVRIYVFVDVRLRGEKDFRTLVKGISKPLDITNGYRMLTARDFATEGVASADVSAGEYKQDIDLKKKIAEYAQTNPTAPPGVYRINILVQQSNDAGLGKRSYGKASQTIVVPYGSVDEVYVEITEPKNGSTFNNLAPTFSWISSQKDVRVSVYEVGTNHRSPQDALTGGNPCLIWTSYGEMNPLDKSGSTSLTGLTKPIQSSMNIGSTSLTYPPNAQRQLQQNKAYVLLVEAKVQTNRGDMMRPSKPVLFRIADDKVGQILDNFMNTQHEEISSKYFSLRAEPSNWIYWADYGNIILDGVKQNEIDLESVLKDITNRKDLKIEFDIEYQ